MTFALMLNVFLTALVSGWHCALMCGGIAMSFEKKVIFVPRQSLWSMQLIIHIGRISGYTLLGGIIGLIGVPLWQQTWLPIQRLLFFSASILLLSQAFWLICGSKRQWKIPFFNGKFLSHLINQTIPTVIRHYTVSYSWKQHFLKGILWGFVPCGLIYSVLPLAFLSGGFIPGALLMLAFGLGTLPNLLLISRFSAYLSQISHTQWVRYFAVSLMFITACFGLYYTITLPEALLRSGFCLH